MELSRTWVNRPAEINMSLLAASPDATHSAARLDAVYMSGEYGRRALPVEAHTTCGTPASAAAVSTTRPGASGWAGSRPAGTRRSRTADAGSGPASSSGPWAARWYGPAWRAGT